MKGKSKVILAALFTLIVFVAKAQESNDGKKLWAKSILNQKAPDIVVEKWLTDKPDIKGKFVLIDFWATWCPPCRTFIPILNGFSKKYADKLVVIGISDEPAEKVEAATGLSISYPEAIDTQKRMSNILQVQGIPHAILIDPKGIVRWEGYPLLAGHQLTDDVLAGLLEKYK